MRTDTNFTFTLTTYMLIDNYFVCYIGFKAEFSTNKILKTEMPVNGR